MTKEPGVEREILDRVRRTETRITKMAQAMNIDVGGGKPEWDEKRGCVNIPTPNCSLKSILDAIPASMAGELEVFVGEEYLTSVRV